MSMASGRVTCTGCSFHGFLQYRPVRVVYRFPDGTEVEAARTFGWCAHCRNIRDIEFHLSAHYQLRERLEELRRQTQTAFFRIRDTLDRLLGSRANKVKEEVEEIESKLRLVETRRSNPRCLVCGSEDTKPLSFDDQGMSKDLIHECGGRLRLEPPDPDAPEFSYWPETIRLDPEGRRLA